MQHTKLISIIIPTFNRCDILKKTLASVQDQKEVDCEQVEVVVVNDGGTDGTKEMIQEKQKDFSFSLQYVEQENKGQGSARNVAFKKAKGHIVIIIGDDIILDPFFFHEHIKVHTKYLDEHIACLGFTTWHKDLTITPFMYFLEHGGPQFNYPKLEKEKIFDWEMGLRKASFWYFYTSNISLKRSFLEGMQFDEGYTSYGWEDIDFGYRLEKEKKMEIFYNKKAVGYHYHEMQEYQKQNIKNQILCKSRKSKVESRKNSFKEKMISIAKNAVLFDKRYSEVGVLPTGLKKFIFQVLSFKATIFCLKAISHVIPQAKQLYFYALSKRYFLEAMKKE